MNRTHEPVLRPPISFAHRGASAVEAENTLPAFELALQLGAMGLESDVWLSSDGVAVLDHHGLTGRRFRRSPISTATRDALESHIPALDDLYSALGVGFELSLDVRDTAAMGPVVDLARSHEQRSGEPVLSRLWLCHPDWEQLARWRPDYPDVKLVNSTGLRRMSEGAERRAAQLANAGIDAVNMHFGTWTGGLVVLFRRFELFSFGWDAQHDRMLDELLAMGIDAVYSDHVQRMTDAMARAGW